MRNLTKSLLASAALLAAGPSHAGDGLPLLDPGMALVTGFSGVIEPAGELPVGTDIIAETLINPDGISARIHDLRAPGHIWDARAWQPEPVNAIRARDIGQVFGVTLDDAGQPNAYVAATSAYGLHITKPDDDNDGRPERLQKGGKDAQWMEGMWGIPNANAPSGLLGGPGSIWKIDGATGEVHLFANVELDGLANAGAGLGNLAYDPAHKQILVSDLSTGMIHRFGLDGVELGIFDHGAKGRAAAGLSPVAYDAGSRLDITSPDFDPDDPGTWGFAEAERSVWGLAVHEGRLYYAVGNGAEIWSVGLEEKSGAFLEDAQWELDVPKKPKKLPVSDIVFSKKGAMILAQRGAFGSGYDYRGFAEPEKARLYRYWLENPDDAATKSRWIGEPEEYAVGFEETHRAANGGIDLGFGYTKDGFADTAACEASLWSTGENLRRSQTLTESLAPGGAFDIDGLQGVPAGPVKGDNTPPWASYMLDNDPGNTDGNQTDDPFAYGDSAVWGWTGDVAILRKGCGGEGAVVGYYGGAGYGWPEGPGWTTDTNTDVTKCTPGVDCPPPPKQCARVEGDFACDPKTGTWTFSGGIFGAPGMNADTIAVTQASTGVSVPGAPLPYAAPKAPFTLTGGAPGQLMSVNVCIFDKAAMASGKPFDCCKATVTLLAPAKACAKKN